MADCEDMNYSYVHHANEELWLSTENEDVFRTT